MKKTYRAATVGILVALAFVLAFLESLVPVFVTFPGVKLGIANIVTVFALCRLRTRDALFITLARVILAGFAFSGLFASLFALCGGLLSIFAMFLAKKSRWFGVTGISICGGVFHNVGQLVVALFVTETATLAYYLPILSLSGVISGALVGLLTAVAIKRVKLPRG